MAGRWAGSEPSSAPRTAAGPGRSEVSNMAWSMSAVYFGEEGENGWVVGLAGRL